MKSKKMISLTLAGMMVLPMVAYGSEDPAGQICQKLLDQKSGCSNTRNVFKH